MGTISTWSYSQSDLEETFDKVKIAMLRALVDEGALAEDLADQWASDHTIILSKKSIFRTITDRWSKADGSNDASIIKVVRTA